MDWDNLRQLGLFLLSLYLAWGWVTVADIKAKCQRDNVDFDEVMQSLIATGPGQRPNGEHYGEVRVEMSWSPTKYPAFERYALSFGRTQLDASSLTNSSGIVSHKIDSFAVFDGGFIEPFAALSENVLNFLFASGLGCLMSCSILLIKTLRKNSLTVGYVFLRPLAGGLLAGCLFLIVLAGGRVLWESASPVSCPSIGLLAAFAALYCERSSVG